MGEARKREGQQLLLRFADGSDLKDRLQEVAKLNNRTLTQEILFRLESSLEADVNADDPADRAELGLVTFHKKKASRALAQRLDALEARVSALEGK